MKIYENNPKFQELFSRRSLGAGNILEFINLFEMFGEVTVEQKNIDIGVGLTRVVILNKK